MKTLEQINNLVIVDSNCILCSRIAKFIIKNDDKKFNFTSFNSEYLKSKNLDFKNESVIVIKDNKLFNASDAVIIILDNLRKPYKFFVIIKYIPKFIRDYIYNFIAKNRYKIFGQKNECLLDSIETSRLLK